jgi:predicted MFS family arabinose efflux permease
VVGSSPAFTFSRALRTRQFWIVCLMYICFGLVQLTVMVHIVPYAVDQQISPITAAVILSLIGAVSFLARIIVGIASDRVKVKKAVVFCLGLVLLSMVWLCLPKYLQLYFVVISLCYGLPSAP